MTAVLHDAAVGAAVDETAVATARVSTAPVALPRVNLLPPHIEQQRRFRRVQLGLAGAVAGALVLVGALTVAAAGTQAEAEEELAASTAVGVQLRTQTARYAEVTALRERAEAADAVLVQAMGAEVRWSEVLGELSTSVPPGVWLKEIRFTQTGGAAASTGTATGTATGVPVGTAAPGTIGTATFTGVGSSHDDVAAWLDSLATRSTTYSQPTFSSSEEALVGTAEVVTFSSAASLVPGALSERFTARTPGGS